MIQFFIVRDADGAILGARIGTEMPPDESGITIVMGAVGQTMVDGVSRWNNRYIDGVQSYAPPALNAEQIAALGETEFHRDLVAAITKAFFNHENRLRTLEGKAAITWEQFKSAIRGMT